MSPSGAINSNLPAIRGEILKSTPGDPGSYPSTDSGYDVISKWSDDPAGVSFGNGAISQEITITKEDSEQYNLGASVDIQAGGGYKGFAVEFMFGATFSLNPSGGWMLRRENVYEKNNYIYAGTDASAGHDSLRQSDRRNHACCHIS